MTLYYLTTTNSDLSGGDDFNRELSTTKGSSGTQSISIAGSATETSYGFTASGVPGALGAGTCDFTVKVNIKTGGPSRFLKVSLSRVNAAGTVQSTTSETAEQETVAGILTFTITGANLGTWASGDRLRCNYILRNGATMAAASPAYGLGNDNTYVDFTFTASSTAYTLDCDAGSFALTGQDVGLTTQFKVDAAQGTFTLTGQDAALLWGYGIIAEVGTFTLTGNAADLVAALSVAADAGAFTLTGQDAGLAAGYQVAADVGSFILTGNDAEFLAALSVAAESGTFTLTGQDVTLTAALTLEAGAGVYTLTGNDVTLTFSGWSLLPGEGTWTNQSDTATWVVQASGGNWTVQDGTATWVIQPNSGSWTVQ